MLSWLYDVRLDPRGIRFMLFQLLTLHLLEFSNIKSVSEIGRAAIGAWNAYNFKNRFLARSFLLETHRGWFTRKILVTPKDPEAFVKSLVEQGIEVRSGPL